MQISYRVSTFLAPLYRHRRVLTDFLHFSTTLAPLHQELLVFHRIFPLLHFSSFLALLHQKSFGFSQEFPLLMQTINIHTMMPAESVIFYRISDPKQFLSVKLFFTYSKISPPEFIYVGLFLRIRKLQPETKIYVCNHFGRNGSC